MSFNFWDSILTLIIALLAFAVAIWQARRTAKLTLKAHQIQVIADAFREIRSPEFLAHYKRVLSFPGSETPGRIRITAEAPQREYLRCMLFLRAPRSHSY